MSNKISLITDVFKRGLVDEDDPFEEEPVPLEVFLYDAGYLKGPPLSAKQLEFLKVADDDDPKTNTKTEFVLQWGKGSGKDYLSGVFIARRIYKLLCLKNPQRYYDMADNVNIDLLNVAYNASQAGGIFFKQFIATIKDKKCWDRWGGIDPKNGEVRFPKGITAHSGHSDREGQEGYNLFSAVADEISAFKTNVELGISEEDKGTLKEAKSRSAEGIIRMLRSSIRSRFPRVGKLVMLSYPRYRGDAIQTLYNEGLHRKNTYVSFGSTFEVNPTKKREDYQDEYDNDPVDAAAKYECNPPYSRSNYYTPEIVIKAYDFDKDNPYNSGSDDLAGWFHPYSLGIDTNLPCWIHVDLALRHDAAGFAMGYCGGYVLSKIPDLSREMDYKHGIDSQEMKPIIHIPLITRWKAPKGSEIDFGVIRSLIIRLRDRGFRIKGVSYDQYQSVDSMQILRKLGFSVKQISADLNLTPHQTLREVIKDGRLRCPVLGNKEKIQRWIDLTEQAKSEDIEVEKLAEKDPILQGHVLSDIDPIASELLGLELLNGAKVNHSNFSGKDMVDALAVVTSQVVGYSKGYARATVYEAADEEDNLVINLPW